MLGNKLSFIRRFSSTGVRKTALHKYHSEALGGKLVEFAGYEMPVLYSGENGGVMKEHLYTRKSCGIFDVSHMG
jgi:aminomethyltransferase